MEEKHQRPKYFPTDVLKQAEIVFKGWEKYKDGISVSNLTIENLKVEIDEVKKAEKKLETLLAEIEKWKEELPNSKRELYELVQKVRNAARSSFGIRDPRLTELGLNPTAKRGRPPKRKAVKQLGLELSPDSKAASNKSQQSAQTNNENFPPENAS
jgi:FtsZ-binding cell division protein ZapB